MRTKEEIKIELDFLKGYVDSRRKQHKEIPREEFLNGKISALEFVLESEVTND